MMLVFGAIFAARNWTNRSCSWMRHRIKNRFKTFWRLAMRCLRRVCPAPEFFAVDLETGFLALSDFGDRQLLGLVQDEPEAVLSILSEVTGLLNTVARVDCTLPVYSESMLRAEMDLFPTWYLTRLLGLNTDRCVLACMARRL
jgi:aminoglycoside/choline kinase family phosphotransferase